MVDWVLERYGARDRAVTGDLEAKRPFYYQFAAELTRTLRAPVNGDFSMQTKRVVQRWFERGLSGHVLWAIGKELMMMLLPQPRVVHHG
jgi:hypothetical protein